MYARRGGFARIVTVPRSGPVDVRTWDIMGHEYSPEGAPRHVMASARLSLGVSGGATVGVTGTDVVARIPVGTGSVLQSGGDLSVAGSGVAGV